MNRLLVPLLAFLTRRVPSFRGRWRLLKWLGTKDTTLCRLGERRVRIPAAGLMRVDPADFVDRYLYLHGEYERPVIAAFQRFLRPGDCALDIGANIGFFTLAAARLVGLDGLVHSFEPSPCIFGRLKENIELNRLRNVRLHSCAVSDCCQKLSLTLGPRGNSGLTSIRRGMRTGVCIPVNAVSLDSIMDQLPAAVRLIKIDVEGAEALALEGMQRLLRRDHPVIVLEMTDSFLRELGASAKSLNASLIESGYRVFGLEHPICELEDAPTEQCNVLAVPQESRFPERPSSN